jgi:hypothetical protein
MVRPAQPDNRPDTAAPSSRRRRRGLCRLWLALALPLAAALLGAGCRQTGWLAERRRDLADVGTASVGLGLGAQLRLGPLHLTPLMLQTESAGLRGGEWFRAPGLTADVECPPQEVGLIWWSSSIWDLPEGCPDRDRLRQRGKAHLATPLFLPESAKLHDFHTDTPPFLSLPRTAWPAETLELPRYPAAWHTQIEVSLALLGSLRLGVNPGELADFLLGWIQIDLYRDDLWGVPPDTAAATPMLKPMPWSWAWAQLQRVPRLWPRDNEP